MKTYSMTGFSRSQRDNDQAQCIIELKSVNSRYIDLHFRLPDCIKSFEMDIRKQITQALNRGKIECSVQWITQNQTNFTVDQTAVNHIIETTQPLVNRYNLAPLSMAELLGLPNVLTRQPIDNEMIASLLMPALSEAITALMAQRQQEGTQLVQHIESRLIRIDHHIDALIENAHLASTARSELLRQKLTELMQKQANIPLDESRFEQELIYYLQKMDITEEIDRLRSHIQSTKTLLNTAEPKGRKLDFLIQEMNREANTIGAKSQHVELSTHVIELKVLLEQIREQVQNIE
ncbi:YicC/YloC family endoribonuclease [Ostreibacterium oceani]|uniref:YicC family protein n=1 Tax=Ostreibacterium oceani TaxID=2654998 RepID=A0A6N7EX18_9GAMM|nr:YicC/YloC family endoribonuclease [Ostreibacterium oceani]MPV86473.1 YicC family protein [Ostreibacterium oceani]